MKLSIAVVTMNRSRQLLEALESCVACELPADTQFVIIDNASTDQTEGVVSAFFANKSFSVYYEKMTENLGCGIGRNYAYSKCLGEYCYFLDDDAYIGQSKPDFFSRAIDILDSNPTIGTLTTQIYDLMWKNNRVSPRGPKIGDSLRKCYMFCGGSHFLCRRFFGNSVPYFPNKYGYEEIKPSLRVANAGLINAFAEDLLIIHNPLVNKWNFDDEKNAHIVINELACQKAMKISIYPRIVTPLISLAYFTRCQKFLNKERKVRADQVVSSMLSQYEFGERIKLSTVIRLFRDFGFSIF